MTNYTYSSLGTAGTVTATAGDVSVSAHILQVVGAPSFDTRMIESASIIAVVAESAGAITVTPTNAASSDFSLVVGQYINGVKKSIQISTVTAATGSSATTICNAWRAQLAAAAPMLQVTPSGTATLVITAKAGYPLISVDVISLSATSGPISLSAGTAGTAAVGTYAALTNLGAVTIPALVSGQSYTQFKVVSRSASANEVGGNVSQSRNVHTVCINASATNYAALAARLVEIIAALPSGGTTYSDPAFVSLG